MASKIKFGPQDMPPKDGYQSIQYSRVALRRLVSPVLSTVFAVSSLTIGVIGFYFSYRHVRRNDVEIKAARLAILPLLVAERDRAFLKQIRKNRDEEASLMEDYPGWVVGTYFGEPIFKGEPEDKFFEPIFHEYVAHAAITDSGARYFRCLKM